MLCLPVHLKGINSCQLRWLIFQSCHSLSQKSKYSQCCWNTKFKNKIQRGESKFVCLAQGLSYVQAHLAPSQAVVSAELDTLFGITEERWHTGMNGRVQSLQQSLFLEPLLKLWKPLSAGILELAWSHVEQQEWKGGRQCIRCKYTAPNTRMLGEVLQGPEPQVGWADSYDTALEAEERQPGLCSVGLPQSWKGSRSTEGRSPLSEPQKVFMQHPHDCILRGTGIQQSINGRTVAIMIANGTPKWDDVRCWHAPMFLLCYCLICLCEWQSLHDMRLKAEQDIFGLTSVFCLSKTSAASISRAASSAYDQICIL